MSQPLNAVIASVEKGSRAEKEGLCPGDTIVSVMVRNRVISSI